MVIDKVKLYVEMYKNMIVSVCIIPRDVSGTFFTSVFYQQAVFWLGIMFLMQISRLRFKQSRISMLISHIYVLGCFVNFLVIFRYIWREIVFLKGLVKLMEIGNFEDLLLF